MTGGELQGQLNALLAEVDEFVSFLGDDGFQDFFFVIDSAP